MITKKVRHAATVLIILTAGCCSSPDYLQVDDLLCDAGSGYPESLITAVTQTLYTETEQNKSEHWATGLVGITILTEWAIKNRAADWVYNGKLYRSAKTASNEISSGKHQVVYQLKNNKSQKSEKESLRTVVLQLPPGEDNPRNSEGDFITLKNGRILFIYSRYTGTSSHDHAPACLAGRFSDDGGKTWSKDDFTVLENEGGMNVMSVSLLRLQNGSIALFYLKKNSRTNCIPMMRISTDEAKTWCEPIACITDKQGYFVLNNNRVIQLKNGRLLMAVALHQTPEENKWHESAKIFTYYSDDNGNTWHCSEEVRNPSGVVTQEPGVIELKDGTLMMFIRAGGGFQQLSYSKDKGQTWSPMVASNLHSPISPASIARIPSTKDLLLVWNNNDGSNPLTKDKRTPLTVAISKDEGKSWQHITDLETDPDGWYCYIAIHFTKKDVLLGYCAGMRSQGTGLAITNVSLIRQKDLYKKILKK